MVRSFSLCILFGDKPHLRPPEQIGPGWDMTEIPVALQILPFESEANWAAKKAEIASWNLAPIRVSSHFLQFWGLRAVGPDVDEEQLEFWTRRAFRRLAELGVATVGIYGGFFAVPEGFPREKALEQGLRFAHLLADHASMSASSGSCAIWTTPGPSPAPAPGSAPREAI